MVSPTKARLPLVTAALLLFVFMFAVELVEADCMLGGANCIPATSGNTGKKGKTAPQCCGMCAEYSKTYLGKGKYSYQYKCTESQLLRACDVLETSLNPTWISTSSSGVLTLRLIVSGLTPGELARCVVTNDPAIVPNLATYLLLNTASLTTPTACTTISCQGAQTSVFGGYIDSAGTLDVSSPPNTLHSEGVVPNELAPPLQSACMIVPSGGPSVCSGAPSVITLVAGLTGPQET